MQTRKQKMFLDSLKRVTDVANMPDKKVAQNYGGLCHKFPILIRNHGLMQTYAWIDSKASGDQKVPLNKAYKVLSGHIASALGVQENELTSKISEADLQTYMRYTYTLMDTWVYHKRFAVSILKAESATAADEDVSAEQLEVAS